MIIALIAIATTTIIIYVPAKLTGSYLRGPTCFVTTLKIQITHQLEIAFTFVDGHLNLF